MIGRAHIAVKTVIGGIDIDLDTGLGVTDFLDVGQRNAVIMFAEMHLYGAGWFFLSEGHDLAAVIASGCRDLKARGA